MTISRRKREFTREGHRSGFSQETVCEGTALLERPDNGRVRADSIGCRGYRLCRLPEDGVDDHHDANHRGRQAVVARRLLTLPGARVKTWRARRDSNPQPSDPKSVYPAI